MAIALAFPETIHPGFVQERGKDVLYAISPIENPIEYQELISCLIKYESSGNKSAKGDWNGQKYLANGILQFHESTFETYKRRYGMDYLRYNDARSQIVLADRMLREDFSNLSHWSVRYNCYEKIH